MDAGRRTQRGVHQSSQSPGSGTRRVRRGGRLAARRDQRSRTGRLHPARCLSAGHRPSRAGVRRALGRRASHATAGRSAVPRAGRRPRRCLSNRDLPALRAEGGVDPDRLRTALHVVWRDHPQLGAAFVADRLAAPAQLVPRNPVPDLAVWPERVVDPTTLERIEVEELRRAVDVTRPPLVRALLVEQGPDAAVLLLAAHHLAMDGWSTPILAARILAAYASATDPRPARTDGYEPYRRYLLAAGQQDTERARSAWSEHLADLAEPSRLADATARSTDEVRAVSVPLSQSTADRLTATLQKDGLTLSTALNGAWAYALGRTLGRPDVVFGTTVAGRNFDLGGASGEVIGLLSQTLPVRVALRPNESWRLQLTRLQLQRAILSEHELLPLPDIEQLAGHPGMFDTLVVVENYPDLRIDPHDAAAGLHMTGVTNRGSTHYPVTLTALPGTGIHLVLEVNPAQVSDDMATRLVEDVTTVLHALADGLGTTPLEVPAP